MTHKGDSWSVKYKQTRKYCNFKKFVGPVNETFYKVLLLNRL